MNSSLRIFLFGSALLLGACSAPVAKLTEETPKRPGFEWKAGDARMALERYVLAAENAWQKLDREPANVEARRDYNFAVARIVGTVRDAKLTPWAAPIKLGGRTLAWKRDRHPERDPALYELIPADQLEIPKTAFDEREVRDGLGAPLVAKRTADQAHEYAPTPHFFYSATAVARFEGTRCELALEYPLKTENVKVGRRTFPLAADFTAPLAMMLVEMHPEKLGLPRLLHPAKFAETTRRGTARAIRSEQDGGACGAWAHVVAGHLVSPHQPPAHR